MLFLLIFLALIAIIIWKTKEYYDMGKGLPPGPTPLPFIGHLNQLYDCRKILPIMKKWSKKYGPVFTVWLPGPIIMITDFEKIRQYYVKEGDSFTGRPGIRSIILARGHKYGIVFSDGDRWRDHRQFSLQVLRNLGLGKNLMQERILDEVTKTVAYVKELVKLGEPIDPDDILAPVVGNIISVLVLGKCFQFNDSEFIELRKLVSGQMQSISNPFIMLLDILPWTRFVPGIRQLGFDKINSPIQKMNEFFFRYIEKNRCAFNEAEKNDPTNYIMAYLGEVERRKAHGEPVGTFDDRQLMYNVCELWVAALETTTSTMLWGFLNMIKYPYVQMKLHTELDSLIPIADKDTLIKLDDRIKLPYTIAVIMEMQRVGNIFSLNAFRVTSKDVIMEGYKVPANTRVCGMISSVMSDPVTFPEPLEFKPERFLEELGNGELQVKKCDQLVPFSMGKRQCLGENLARMELFLIFSNLFRHFEVKKVPKEPVPTSESKFGVTLCPQNFKCLFIERL